MAAKIPVWRGSKSVYLQGDYPKFFSRGDSEGFRFRWEGPYLTLLAQKPQRGAVILGYPGYYVEEVTVDPAGAGPSGPGVMMATATKVGVEGVATPEDQTIVEIDAGSLEKSIYSHPKLAGLSAIEIAAVKKAMEDKEPIPGPSIPGPLSEPMQKLADYLKKGGEGFLVAAPVVQITTTSVNKPAVGTIGRGTRTTTKPHASAPDGWVWLKTADKAVQQGAKGKWERVQVWSAAEEWDEYFYGP
jgi:hypothetical protein